MSDNSPAQDNQDSAEAAPKPKRVPKADVIIANHGPYRDKEFIPVFSLDFSKAWLVSKEHLPESKPEHKAKLSQDILDRSVQAASFADILAELMPTIEAVQLSFWRHGIVSLEELADIDGVRRALNKVLPGPHAFTKFSSQ